MTQGTIPNLQILRAFAASIVVVFHAVIACAGYGFGENIYGIDGWGWQGVDIFFVISGFVMILTQHRKNRSIPAFILDRIVRIVPLYWLLTVALFTLLIFAGEIFRQLSADVSVLLQSLSFTSVYLAKSATPGIPLIYVGWTLEYEIFFYLLFAFCLALPRWRERILAQAVVLLAMVLFTPMKAFCFEFLMGELLALFYIFGKRSLGQGEAAALCALGLLLLFSTAQSGKSFQQQLWGYRLVTAGVPALLIVAGALYTRQVEQPVLAMLGDASYSIYLFQVFVLSLVYKVAAMAAPDMSGYIVMPAAVAVSLAAGVGLHMLVERPMTQAIKGALAERAVLRARAGA